LGSIVRILVFTEGTIIDDRARDGQWKLFGNAAEKLRAWENNGATIVYLSSKRNSESLERVRRTLREGKAPEGELLYRKGDEDYGDVAAGALPDVIVEDDCRSIGGEAQMTYPKLKPGLKERVRSVVVPEFAGIDHLPEDPRELNTA
jgi:hypothetical protein